MESLYNLYKKFDRDKICLSYLGHFNDEVTHKIIQLSDFNLQNNDGLNKVKSRVSFLIAECFQNVVRHKLEGEEDPDKHEKFFQVNIFPHMVCLSSANPVDMKTKALISEKINELNALNEDQLKELHKTLLSNSEFTKKGGAGLGLIEMARKSRHPLRYYFSDIDSERSEFFLLMEVINKKETESNITETQIETIVRNYNTFALENIVLFYKGDFTKESIQTITEMLQPNLLRKETLPLGKKALISILELIQNISKHGLAINGVKNGVFFISEKDKQYQVTAGNFVDARGAQKIHDRLGTLKDLSEEEVDAVYKKVLFNEEISEAGNGSLGLLEISRSSKNRFEFNVENLGDGLNFFAISIKL